jgi:hypothetical protein
MSQFPKNRAEILDLAQKVLNGFSSHPDIFTNPPFGNPQPWRRFAGIALESAE